MDEIKLIFTLMNEISLIGVMVDVGAMDGCSCKRFLSAGWKVIAFEPNTSQRNKLCEFKKRNQIDNLAIEPYAVSNKNKKNIPFFTSEESIGISSLVPFHPTHKRSQMVESVRLDDYMRKNKINKVDFLKIDTEGYDYFVLQSYPWDLYKPLIVLCEFEDNKTKDKLKYQWNDIGHFLKKNGYYVVVSEWYPIKKYGEKHEWRCFKKYPCQLDDVNGWGNLIAFSNKKTRDLFLKINGS